MIKSLWAKVNRLVRKVVNRVKHKEPWYKYYSIQDEIEYPKGSIYELIEKTAEAYPFNIAYEYFGKKVTYREFMIQIKKTASSLVELGVSEGDRVTICMPNTPSAIITFYAVNMIGAVASMIHPLSSENEIEFYLKESNSKYILVIDLVYDKLMKIVKNTNVEKIIVSSVSEGMGKLKHALYWFFSGRKLKIEKNEMAISYNDLLKIGFYYKDFIPCKRDANDDAVILYSGGTTG